MQKLLTEWRKYLTEQIGRPGPRSATKKKLDPFESSSIKEKLRAHARSLLPDVHPENRKRTAYLLGQYFNPKIPKPKGWDPSPGVADLINPATNDFYGDEGPLTNKELLAFASALGQKQYLHIKSMQINMLYAEGWAKLMRARPNIKKQTQGFYSPKTKQIYIQVEFSGLQLASTLLHELWHAIDHTEIRGERFLENVKAIPEPKKVAIRKIIAQDFKPMFNDHGVREHLSTGFMSTLNRKAFDALLTTKTHARGEKFTVSKAGLSRKDRAWEEYVRSDEERNSRFKNLIDAFAKENHPKSIRTRASDVVDFCVNPKKYYKHHKDVRSIREDFVFCKDYDNSVPSSQQLRKCIEEHRERKRREGIAVRWPTAKKHCRAKFKKARKRKHLIRNRTKRDESIRWMNRIAKTMKVKQEKLPRYEPGPEQRAAVEEKKENQ
jgi:hypothetical protein